jgi:HAD superfamily hydrolase (TIGR01549 family)
MRTILFDFDGTVADTLPLIFTAFRSTFQQYLHRHYTDEEILAMFGPTETDILQAMIPPEQLEQALDHFFRVYAEGHRHVHNPAEIALMLDRLREAGFAMGIVTGKGRRSADISLQAWGLDRYFDVVITGDDVSRPKPDPEGILSAMKQLEHAPNKRCTWETAMPMYLRDGPHPWSRSAWIGCQSHKKRAASSPNRITCLQTPGPLQIGSWVMKKRAPDRHGCPFVLRTV